MKTFDYDEQDNKTMNYLKRSRLDFKFGREDIKASLMAQISQEKQTPAFSWKTLSLPYGAAMTIAVIFIVSSTAITYADGAKPGDKLFELDQMTEKAVLAIPMPSSSRAKFRANIVEERLAEMDVLQKEDNSTENEAAAVEQSQENLTQAVEKITQARKKMDQRGNQKAVEKLDLVLTKLEKLADEHEVRANRTLKKLKNDEERKFKVDEQINEIKKAHDRAHDTLESKNEKQKIELEEEVKD